MVVFSCDSVCVILLVFLGCISCVIFWLFCSRISVGYSLILNDCLSGCFWLFLIFRWCSCVWFVSVWVMVGLVVW